MSVFDRSGLSVHAFARQRGIDPQRLYWWRRRLAESDSRPGAALTFVEVKSDAGAARIEVVLRSGRVLRLAEPFDADAVRRLIEVLE